ncbi:MAG: lysozyme inhibitor LprI family protein [Gammaproteobacteria bacterium]
MFVRYSLEARAARLFNAVITVPTMFPNKSINRTVNRPGFSPSGYFKCCAQRDRMKSLLLAVLLAAPSAALAQTQMELTDSACAKYRQADAALNASYGQILAEHKKEAAFVAKFKEAQRAWVKFRDAHISSVFPAENAQAEYGSSFPMCSCAEAASLTSQRVEQLKQWLAADNEGDVCAGSKR